MKKATPISEENQMIRDKQSNMVFNDVKNTWLDTGNKRLNAVLGSPELGVPYGKIIELHGPNSHGKTMLALLLAALGQAKGAKIRWADFENSYDERWTAAQGIDSSQVKLYVPVLKPVKKGKIPPLETHEEVFDRMYVDIKTHYLKFPQIPQILVIDSLAAVSPGPTDVPLAQLNMRSRMELPMFLSAMFKRFVGLIFQCNTMMICINQIRLKPMAFGNPEYTPGGEAAKFYASVRVGVRRVKGGRLVQNQKVVGLRGVLTNVKNKAGGGSTEGARCGFETHFGRKTWKFPTVEDVRKESQDEE